MNETPDQFEARLRATFEVEAAAHVCALRTAVGELAGAAAHDAAAREMLATLHTLKGAAHAVGQADLELLCHVMERVCLAWRGRDLAPVAGQLELLREACDAALANVARPDGRTRNMTMALVHRLVATAESME